MMGEELVKNKRNETALPFYQQAVEHDSSQPIYQIRLWNAHFRARRYVQARETFEHASARFPRNATTLIRPQDIARSR